MELDGEFNIFWTPKSRVVAPCMIGIYVLHFLHVNWGVKASYDGHVEEGFHHILYTSHLMLDKMVFNHPPSINCEWSNELLW